MKIRILIINTRRNVLTLGEKFPDKRAPTEPFPPKIRYAELNFLCSNRNVGVVFGAIFQ